MLPLLSLCGRDELTKLHELMSDYYVLNDEGRKKAPEENLESLDFTSFVELSSHTIEQVQLSRIIQ